MAYKWNLDGVAVDTDNNLIVEGDIKPAGGEKVYDITSPTSDLRTFDPSTATIDDLYDFVATLAKDLVG